MILGKGQLPASTRGHRILVRPDPPIVESDIIIKPEAYEYLPNKGVLVGAGMTALDEMYDHGDELGDHVWWGKFAGVIEEWDHIEDETAKGRACEHVWVQQRAPSPKSRRWQCSECKSTRLAEHMLVMNVGDLLANESLQRRIEAGQVAIKRGKTADGRTQHYIDRKDR
jgi:hypothetical protein